MLDSAGARLGIQTAAKRFLGQAESGGWRRKQEGVVVTPGKLAQLKAQRVETLPERVALRERSKESHLLNGKGFETEFLADLQSMSTIHFGDASKLSWRILWPGKKSSEEGGLE